MPQYQKKDLKDLSEQARSGNTAAQSALGLLSELGLTNQGFTPDLKTAASWYEQAAEGGAGAAAVSVAKIYQKGGTGIAADPKKAAHYFNVGERHGIENPELRYHKSVNATLTGSKVALVDCLSEDRSKLLADLQKKNYRAYAAEDIKSLRELISKNPDIACFFVDVALFAPNFGKVLQTIREIKVTKSVPIVVMTTVSDAAVIQEAKKYQISSWLLKPAQIDIVSNAIKRFAG